MNGEQCLKSSVFEYLLPSLSFAIFRPFRTFRTFSSNDICCHLCLAIVAISCHAASKNQIEFISAAASMMAAGVSKRHFALLAKLLQFSYKNKCWLHLSLLNQSKAHPRFPFHRLFLLQVFFFYINSHVFIFHWN